MSPDFDAIVVGAGFAGIRMLYLFVSTLPLL
jgi:cation diffusion facilitator CzcD-associated flavoprotein CzcO